MKKIEKTYKQNLGEKQYEAIRYRNMAKDKEDMFNKLKKVCIVGSALLTGLLFTTSIVATGYIITSLYIPVACMFAGAGILHKLEKKKEKEKKQLKKVIRYQSRDLEEARNRTKRNMSIKNLEPRHEMAVANALYSLNKKKIQGYVKYHRTYKITSSISDTILNMYPGIDNKVETIAREERTRNKILAKVNKSL